MAIGENQFPKVRIVGGPHATDTRIYLDDVDISHYTKAIAVRCDVDDDDDGLVHVSLRLVVAEVEIDTEAAVAVSEAQRKTANGLRETTGIGDRLRTYQRVDDNPWGEAFKTGTPSDA